MKSVKIADRSVNIFVKPISNKTGGRQCRYGIFTLGLGH